MFLVLDLFLYSFIFMNIDFEVTLPSNNNYFTSDIHPHHVSSDFSLVKQSVFAVTRRITWNLGLIFKPESFLTHEVSFIQFSFNDNIINIAFMVYIAQCIRLFSCFILFCCFNHLIWVCHFCHQRISSPTISCAWKVRLKSSWDV